MPALPGDDSIHWTILGRGLAEGYNRVTGWARASLSSHLPLTAVGAFLGFGPVLRRVSRSRGNPAPNPSRGAEGCGGAATGLPSRSLGGNVPAPSWPPVPQATTRLAGTR